ncbi:MAG: hypothetical protein EPN93_03775 [Spirochaetes bacterium]|nr:MAG: hypothetical protein EPN93_03775 [Spirochaetota bacterium]
MKRTALITLTILLAGISPRPSGADADWKTVINEEGITVETRSVAGSDIDEFRATAVIEKPIEVVGELLADVPNQINWIKDCVEVKIVSQENEQNLVQYYVIKTPWPLNYRDVIFITKTKVDWQAGYVDVTSIATAEPLVPVRDGCLRITNSEQHWIFQRIAPDRTMVVFTNTTNPGGAIPAFVANAFSKDMPFHTLRNMRAAAENPVFYERAKAKYNIK